MARKLLRLMASGWPVRSKIRPARRRQQAEVDAVLVGQRGEALGLEHLQLVEPADQRRHQHRLRAAQQQAAAVNRPARFAVALAEAHHSVGLARAGPCRANASGTFSGSRGPAPRRAAGPIIG
jgi:hypothetical protein